MNNTRLQARLLAHHIDSTNLSCSSPPGLIRLPGKSRFPKVKFALLGLTLLAVTLSGCLSL